jgi:hypothetical protein
MDAINSVSAYLKNNYNLIVEDYTFGSGFDSVSLRLVTNMDRGSAGSDDGAADIKSNVDDSWANTLTVSGTGGGQGLISSSITVVTVPNDAQGASSDSYSSTSSASDFIQNLLPTWLGGSPVTSAQLAARKDAQTQALKTTSDNASVIASSPAARAANATALSTQTQANLSDQNKLAADANAAAKASDESSLSMYLWVGGAIVAVVVLIALAPTVNRLAGA